jgi:DNA-binding XRE family transcriptional regulator
MREKEAWTEEDLAILARQFRERAGKSRAQAARDMGVSQTSIFHAEESPQQSLFKLRARMIEAYSPHKVVSQILLVKKGTRKG